MSNPNYGPTATPEESYRTPQVLQHATFSPDDRADFLRITNRALGPTGYSLAATPRNGNFASAILKHWQCLLQGAGYGEVVKAATITGSPNGDSSEPPQTVIALTTTNVNADVSQPMENLVAALARDTDDYLRAARASFRFDGQNAEPVEEPQILRHTTFGPNAQTDFSQSTNGGYVLGPVGYSLEDNPQNQDFAQKTANHWSRLLGAAGGCEAFRPVTITTGVKGEDSELHPMITVGLATTIVNADVSPTMERLVAKLAEETNGLLDASEASYRFNIQSGNPPQNA